MSILDRLQLLIRSEMTPLRRSPSSPDEARAVLRDVRDSLARLYAAERQVSERYQDLLDEAQSWEDRAALAARAGNDGLAREALQRKRAVELNAESTRRELDRVQREIVQLRDGVDRLRASTATAGPAPTATSSYAPSTGSAASYVPTAAAPGSSHGASYAPAAPHTGSSVAPMPGEAHDATAAPTSPAADAPGWGAAGGWGVRRAPSPWATSGADSVATSGAASSARDPAPGGSPESAPLPSSAGGYSAGPLPPSGEAYHAGPLPPSGPGYLPASTLPSRASAPPTSAERAAATIDRAYDRVDPTLAAMGSRIDAMEADAAAAEIVAADLGDPLADPHAASFARLEREANARRVDAEVDALRARVANESSGAAGDDASGQGGGDDPLERLRRRLGGA